MELAIKFAHMFNSSHRPNNGRLTFCSLFAGRWCLCRGWHSVDRELPDLLQRSCQCARSSSKIPIAPMGRWLTCSNRLLSFNSDRYLVLSGIRTCQPRLQTSHRPDGRLTFVLVVHRVAVSMSYPAPSRLRLPRSPGTESILTRCVLMFKTSHGPDGKLTF